MHQALRVDRRGLPGPADDWPRGGRRGAGRAERIPRLRARPRATDPRRHLRREPRGDRDPHHLDTRLRLISATRRGAERGSRGRPRRHRRGGRGRHLAGLSPLHRERLRRSAPRSDAAADLHGADALHRAQGGRQGGTSGQAERGRRRLRAEAESVQPLSGPWWGVRRPATPPERGLSGGPSPAPPRAPAQRSACAHRPARAPAQPLGDPASA